MRPWARLACAALAGYGTATAAQEYCVTCTAPDAVYRCVLGAPPGITPPASRGQLLCITELARTGGHASCSVGRAAGDQCLGQTRTVLFPSSDPTAPLPYETAQPPPMPPAAGPGTAAEGQADPAPELPASDQPSTAAKIAKQTVDASNKGLKKAGEAVSDTAQSAGSVVKKTWNCLSSFFSDC